MTLNSFVIVTSSGKTLNEPSKIDLSEKILRAKAKKGLPQSREENDEKENQESNKEVVEAKKPQSEARPIIQAIQEILRYAKLRKKLMPKKKLVKGEINEVTNGYSDIMDSKVAKKKDDPRAFTIPCIIGTHVFAKDLCDLVDKFILRADYVVLDCEIDQEVPIILDRPFLYTRRAIIDLEMGEIKFMVQKDEVSLKIFKTKKCTTKFYIVSVVDVENEKVIEEGL
ncbi:uncharacterized protein LOC124889620 [Capsicum annuum]|uniref:uncharacterized protein LOC124889620 n=1 Tax=Capsicum annuum TaxID=4072 RepID=UPI001FB11490|nr:uncharacterized protein LOC124889620 [Capsicum annuum]